MMTQLRTKRKKKTLRNKEKFLVRAIQLDTI